MRKFFVLLVLVLVPALALAVPKESATYKAVKSHGANAKLIEKGIEGAVEEMSFITRPIARTKLKKSNIAFKTISLKFKGKTVSIQHDERKPVDSPADGSKAKWTREDGEVFTVSQKVSDKDIVQIFYADEGVKTLKYEFSDDFSKMSVDVMLESPKLAAPLKYKLDYAK